MDLASIVRPPVVAQITEGTGYQLIANPETLDWIRQRASSRAGSSTRVLCMVVDPLPIQAFDAALVEKVLELLTGRLPGRKATLFAATLRTSHNLVLVKPPRRDVLREVSMRVRPRSRRPR